MKRALPLSLMFLAACGDEPTETVATFTSDVVQRETCRVTGDSDREACTREISSQRVRVTLVEDEEQRVWLTGLTRQSVPGRSLLGTRDQLGGYLFYDERIQTNANNGCTLTEEIVLSLKVDDDAEPEDVGVDDCVALEGRENRYTTTSPECDDVNDPAQQIQRIVRRRWERADGCSSDALEASEG